MGRNVTPSPLPYEVLALHGTLAELAAPSNMPTDARLRGRIIQALVQRIKKFHPDEFNHVFGSIACIAKFEAMPDSLLPADMKDEGIATLLKRIAADDTLNVKHSKPGIVMQRDGLHDLLVRDRYPAKGNATARLNWIKAHWEQLTTMISITPCVCQPYRIDYSAFREAVTLRPKDLSTIRNATDFLLGYCHNLTTVSAENFQKALRSKR